ncbi:hypothetical protein [Methyloversatilis discipulorum]|uniref:hypothetical protein n=1 Tax=Methyloversatilis discipulorum TaxID=1119528 RepID=UPI00313797D6
MMDSHNVFLAARGKAPAEFSIAMFPLSNRVRCVRLWNATAVCRCVPGRRKIGADGNPGNAPGIIRDNRRRDTGVPVLAA